MRTSALCVIDGLNFQVFQGTARDEERQFDVFRSRRRAPFSPILTETRRVTPVEHRHDWLDLQTVENWLSFQNFLKTPFKKQDRFQ